MTYILSHYYLRQHPAQWLWLIGVVVDFILYGGIMFGLLSLVPNRLRKHVVAVVTFLAGLIYSVEFFWPTKKGTDANFLTAFTEQVGDVTNIIYAFALGLGVYSLFQLHGKSLARRRPGWHNNLAFFIAFAAIVAAGFWKDSSPAPMARNVFDLLYNSSVVALGATMFSTIGFYIVSAAYRAFRIRSGEATLMLVAAFIVMIGQVPVGAYLTKDLPQHGALGFLSALKLENLSYWILREPNMAAQRGIAFGVEIGALAMALRTWLSLERGSFFDHEL